MKYIVIFQLSQVGCMIMRLKFQLADWLLWREISSKKGITNWIFPRVMAISKALFG